MPEDIYRWSVPNARRAAKVIGAAERQGQVEKLGAARPSYTRITFFAKITGIGVGPDGTTPVYAWKEQRRVSVAPTVTWEDLPSGRSGDLPGGSPDLHTWAISTNSSSPIGIGVIIYIAIDYGSDGVPFYTIISSGDGSVSVIITTSAGGGKYGGYILVGTATGHSGASITGMSNGQQVVIYNGPELGSTAATTYITPGTATAPGRVIGVDATTSLPIVHISAAMGTNC